MSNYTFRALRDEEADLGYGVIVEAYLWLTKKGIKQWPSPMPKYKFLEWNIEKKNFGLFTQSQIAVVLSLPLEAPQNWSECNTEDSAPWLYALSLADAFRGRGLGKIAVSEALTYLKRNSHTALYAICAVGEGFLPGYYKELGFREVTRKTMQCSPFGLLEYALIRHDLDQE